MINHCRLTMPPVGGVCRRVRRWESMLCGSRGRRFDQRSHPHEVVGGGAEGEDPVDARPTAVPQLAEECDGFHPAKGLLHQFALLLTDGIAGMACGPSVDGTMATGAGGKLRDVRRRREVPQLRDVITCVIGLVR